MDLFRLLMGFFYTAHNCSFVAISLINKEKWVSGAMPTYILDPSIIYGKEKETIIQKKRLPWRR